MLKNSDKSRIKINLFSRKQSDWTVWSEKFMAWAWHKGYKDVLLGKKNVPTDSKNIDLSTAEEKAKEKIRDPNDVVSEAMILLIDGECATGRVSFNVIWGCKTSDLADGNATLAWRFLCNKFKPKSAPSHLALKNEFYCKVLKKASQDPNIWLTELEDLKVQMLHTGSNISDDKLMEHMLDNLLKEYEVVLSKLEDKLGDVNNPLTISEIWSTLNFKFQQIKWGKTPNPSNAIDNETNIALFAGGFKGKCNKCGEWEHKGAQCPKHNSNGGGGGNYGSNGQPFIEKCLYCKKPGHKGQSPLRRKETTKKWGPKGRT